ncbi:MAG: hypothetical protein WCP09_02805 [Candidatus Taylorbacteria bacterium]
MSQIIHKNIGETPLEALEKFRLSKMQSGELCVDGKSLTDTKYSWKDVPLTYAGRLDPMAEGQLMILIGDECKEKEKFLNLNKEYEVEVLFGIKTDTFDALGIVEVRPLHDTEIRLSQIGNIMNQEYLNGYTGKFVQQYPPYSSKTVGGKQLHELARSGALPEEMPTREVEIYSIEMVENKIVPIESEKLLSMIVSRIGLVKGDFRQDQIIQAWIRLLKNCQTAWPSVKIRVRCSSGTYMRSLADRIGQDLGVAAIALSINRTKIGRVFPSY